MLRLLYTVVWHLALPYALWRAARRARISPPFEISTPSTHPIIWIHGVSLGELNAASRLIPPLFEAYRDHAILITYTTASGAQYLRRLIPLLQSIDAGYSSRIHVAKCPFDIPADIHRFLNRWKPRLGIILEVELWPNLIYLAKKSGVKIMLVNARLSRASLRRYVRCAPVRMLLRDTVGCFEHILCQHRHDARRFRYLGTADTSAIGNLKFDAPLSPEDAGGETVIGYLRRDNKAKILFASTRDGEEKLLIDALSDSFWSAFNVIWAPRHPERIEQVSALLRQAGVAVHLHSSAQPMPPDAGKHCYLIDTLGELPAFYRIADIAFVGGSLIDYGGQNVMEAFAHSVPVITGRYTDNFHHVVEQARGGGALVKIDEASAFEAQARKLLDDEAAYRQARAAARDLYQSTKNNATTKAMRSISEIYRPDISGR